MNFSKIAEKMREALHNVQKNVVEAVDSVSKEGPAASAPEPGSDEPVSFESIFALFAKLTKCYEEITTLIEGYSKEVDELLHKKRKALKEKRKELRTIVQSVEQQLQVLQAADTTASGGTGGKSLAPNVQVPDAASADQTQASESPKETDQVLAEPEKLPAQKTQDGEQVMVSQVQSKTSEDSKAPAVQSDGSDEKAATSDDEASPSSEEKGVDSDVQALDAASADQTQASEPETPAQETQDSKQKVVASEKADAQSQAESEDK